MFATPLLALALGVAAAEEVPEPVPEEVAQTAEPAPRWTPEQRYRLGMGAAWVGVGALGAGMGLAMVGAGMMDTPSEQLGYGLFTAGGVLDAAAGPLMGIGSITAAYATGTSGMWGVSSLVMFGAGLGSVAVSLEDDSEAWVTLGGTLLVGSYVAATIQMVRNIRHHNERHPRAPSLWADPRRKTLGLSGRF